MVIIKRAYHNLAHYKDKLYILGGKSLSPDKSLLYMEHRIHTIDLNTYEIEFLNVNTREWQHIVDLPFEITRLTLSYYDNTIFIFNNGYIFTFDLQTNRLLQYEIPLYLIESNICFYKDSLYIIGGYYSSDFTKK